MTVGELFQKAVSKVRREGIGSDFTWYEEAKDFGERGKYLLLSSTQLKFLLWQFVIPFFSKDCLKCFKTSLSSFSFLFVSALHFFSLSFSRRQCTVGQFLLRLKINSFPVCVIYFFYIYFIYFLQGWIIEW